MAARQSFEHLTLSFSASDRGGLAVEEFRLLGVGLEGALRFDASAVNELLALLSTLGILVEAVKFSVFVGHRGRQALLLLDDLLRDL